MRHIYSVITTLLYSLTIILSSVTSIQHQYGIQQPNNLTSQGTQTTAGPHYLIGNILLTDIFVSTTGDDTNNGSTIQTALRTVLAAYRSIARDANNYRNGAYRIRILPGDYSGEYLDTTTGDQGSYGTINTPLLIEAADPAQRPRFICETTISCRTFTIYRGSYIYLQNFDVRMDTAIGGGIVDENNSGDALQCEQCSHLLLRNMLIRGIRRVAQTETLKLNQSDYVFVEDSDVAGAGDNAIDTVAIHHGWFVRNKIHQSVDWCMYLKAGSVDFLVAYNEFYDCGTGGFTAGQGSSLIFMRPPFLQYEAYSLKIVNNIVHDVQGAGFGVNGGWNILIAYNTIYHMSNEQRAHLLEFVPGRRDCALQVGDPDDTMNRATCADDVQNRHAWGTIYLSDNVTISEQEYIPNRNVYVYNNIAFNPTGSITTTMNVLSVRAPVALPANFTGPDPDRFDQNLQIRGNILWTGNINDTNLGAGDASNNEGCQASNPTCNPTQLTTDNAINSIEPQLVAPAQGDFQPITSSNIFSTTVFTIPRLTLDGLPAGIAPATLTETLDTIGDPTTTDFIGVARTSSSPPGAFTGSAVTSRYVIFLPVIIHL